MPNGDTLQPSHPTVEFVLGAIADWVNKYRDKFGHHSEFGQCGPDDVMQIAKDLGVPAAELRELANKGPNGADLLQRLLIALKVDPEKLAKTNPGVMRDLQRLCVACNHKKECAHELAKGTAAQHFHDYCPNAFTLDALFPREEERASRH